MSKPKIIAFYLPQYHPTPDNDKWWGKGFTEWTNVGKAKPLYPGHYQPHLPADLGYYDLRIPEVREAQAELAKEAGVEGFCYWHYWFGNGKRELEKPFDDVLKSSKPDFPFMLAWANESWKGFNFGLGKRNVLLEQTYPGEDDYKAHFECVINAFKDKRYIKIENKPAFMIYKPHLLPNAKEFIDLWNRLARKNGLNGIFFIAHHQSESEQGRPEIESYQQFRRDGFDAVNFVRLTEDEVYKSKLRRYCEAIIRRIFKLPRIGFYETEIKHFNRPIDAKDNVFPTIIPNWDHTPRSGRKGVVLHGSTPDLFASHVRNVLSLIKSKDHKRQVIFLKSWNEWAEGNYMEPDRKYGKAYINVLSKELEDFEKSEN